jgi:hypothetical protein
VSQKIITNKNLLTQQFLLPVSRIADNISISFTKEEVYTVSANADGSIVLYVVLKDGVEYTNAFKINLPDIKKFIRLLECIETNELELVVDNNHIKYNGNGINFNYFLLEENYIQKCPATPEKIKQVQYDTSFTILNTKFNEIMKGSSIATDTDKIYLYTKDKKVYAELNDYERQNVNNITYLITENYDGADITLAIPLILENVRMLAGLKTEKYTVKVNNKLKIVLFEIEQENSKIQFILSALVK